MSRSNDLEMVLEGLEETGQTELFFRATADLTEDQRGKVVTYLLGVPQHDGVMLLETYTYIPTAHKRHDVEKRLSTQIPMDQLTTLNNLPKFLTDIVRAIEDVEALIRTRLNRELPLPAEVTVDRRKKSLDVRRRSPPLYDDMSLLYVDVDHFKNVNDTYGHSTGDRVLQVVAQCLLQSVREGDKSKIYRIGGEEFAAIVYHTSPDQGVIVAERMRNCVEDNLRNALPHRGITISLGVANYRKTCEDKDQGTLRFQADLALYAAKEGGRNQVKVYTPDMMERYARRVMESRR